MTMHFTCKTVATHPNLPPLVAGPVPEILVSVVKDDLAIAQVGLWHGPSWKGQQTVYIGFPSALDDQIRLKVLNKAVHQATMMGGDLALGPIQGNTWFNYRLITDYSDHQPFALEPWNTPQDLQLWQAAGFQPMLTYHSALATPSSHPTDPRADELASKFAHIRLRCFDSEDPQAISRDLAALHSLSLLAFKNNPLYTPLSSTLFNTLYQPMLAKIPLDWVWLAEDQDELVGFLFAYPDPKHGYLILKTLAIHPKRELAGLGRHLSNLIHQQAFSTGWRGVVHALMWDGNESAALSAIRATILRRYAVMGYDLKNT